VWSRFRGERTRTTPARGTRAGDRARQPWVPAFAGTNDDKIGEWVRRFVPRPCRLPPHPNTVKPPRWWWCFNQRGFLYHHHSGGAGGLVPAAAGRGNRRDLAKPRGP
jgi:hypothetical protein